MRVRSIAMDLDNIFWQARAADVISQILSASYYHEEAVNFTEEAADLYKSCGRENFYLYAMGNLALLYSRLRQSDKCLSIIDSLKNHTEKYLPLKLEFMGLAHLMYEMRGEYDKAEQYGDSMLQYVDEIEYLATDLADIAYVKIELGKLEEAKSLLNISAKNLNSSTDSIFFFDSMIQLYTKEGNLTKVIECLKQLSDINNARFKKAVRQSAMVGQRNFFLEESIRTKKTAQRNRQLFIFSSIITFLLLIIGSLIYRNRLNKKNADISKRMTEIILLSKKLEQTDTENYSLNQKLAKHGKDIENLSTLLSERNNEIQILSANLTRNIGQTEQLSLMVQTLLQGRFAHLNTIITEYAVQDENETNYLAFYKNIKHEIDKFKRPENIQEIERMVDDCLDGIISKIRTQIPTMREKDITLISLTLAGLNARAIGLFLGIHPNYTYRRKKQLIKIIADSSAPNAPEIVETLSRY